MKEKQKAKERRIAQRKVDRFLFRFLSESEKDGFSFDFRKPSTQRNIARLRRDFLERYLARHSEGP